MSPVFTRLIKTLRAGACLAVVFMGPPVIVASLDGSPVVGPGQVVSYSPPLSGVRVLATYKGSGGLAALMGSSDGGVSYTQLAQIALGDPSGQTQISVDLKAPRPGPTSKSPPSYLPPMNSFRVDLVQAGSLTQLTAIILPP